MNVMACADIRTVDNRLNLFASFATDVALLAMMVAGILVRKGTGTLWRLVYRQVRERKMQQRLTSPKTSIIIGCHLVRRGCYMLYTVGRK